MIDDVGKLKLFTAGGIIEAHLLQALLRSQGIDAVIKNENLQTGVGELPFVEMWPELWLLHLRDLDRARQLLNEFFNRNTASDWVCTKCNERNPGSFDICWACTETSTDDEDNLTA